jgi:hypothetical protein
VQALASGAILTWPFCWNWIFIRIITPFCPCRVFSIFTTCDEVADRLGGTMLPDAGLIARVMYLGTAHWKRRSVIGTGDEFVKVDVILVLVGAPATFSSMKEIERPFLSYTWIVTAGAAGAAAGIPKAAAGCTGIMDAAAAFGS